MWAPLLHPTMKQWAPIRADLGIRARSSTCSAHLCNPAGVTRRILGVFDVRWLEPMAHVLASLGCERAWIVHGADGLDELTTTGPTHVAELRSGRVSLFEVVPEDAGLPRARLSDLKGGDAPGQRAAIRAVLAGEPGPLRDVVVLDTAAALVVGGKAGESVERGRAGRDRYGQGGEHARPAYRRHHIGAAIASSESGAEQIIFSDILRGINARGDQ